MESLIEGASLRGAASIAFKPEEARSLPSSPTNPARLAAERYLSEWDGSRSPGETDDMVRDLIEIVAFCGAELPATVIEIVTAAMKTGGWAVDGGLLLQPKRLQRLAETAIRERPSSPPRKVGDEDPVDVAAAAARSLAVAWTEANRDTTLEGVSAAVAEIAVQLAPDHQMLSRGMLATVAVVALKSAGAVVGEGALWAGETAARRALGEVVQELPPLPTSAEMEAWREEWDRAAPVREAERTARNAVVVLRAAQLEADWARVQAETPEESERLNREEDERVAAWEREREATAVVTGREPIRLSPAQMAGVEASSLLSSNAELAGLGVSALATQLLMALPGLERETANAVAREALQVRGLPLGPLGKAEVGPLAPWKRAATPFVLGDPSRLRRREWLYGKLLIRKELTATVAPGGVGKTTLAITEAVALATGRPLLGVPLEKPYRVWIWNGEEPEDEMRRRISAVCLYHGISDSDLGGRLFFDNGHDLPIVLAEQSREGVKIFQPMVDALLLMLREREIDVMIVDPFISTHNVAENETNAMQKAVSSWKELAVKANVAISILHHTRKLNGEEASMDSSRGASSFVDKVRIGRSLNVMTKEEAKEFDVKPWNRLGYISFGAGGKANMSARSDTKSWYKLEDVGLGNGNPLSRFAQEDRVGVVVSWTPATKPHSFDPAALERLRKLLASSTWRPAPQSQQHEDWTGVAVAMALGINRELATWKEEAKAEMRRLERSGYLGTEKRIGPSRTAITVSVFLELEAAEGDVEA